MPQFSHLHCHTQFSLLDGAASIPNMIAKAKADGQSAVAITDHGNMFGVFKFVAEAAKHGIKPIIGCEFYVVEDRFQKSFTKEKRDKRYHQLLLAKNEVGYRNLSKLCSLGYIEGLYSKWPRVDRELIKQYSEGLIATTCCVGAEVPQAIMHKGEEEAEKIFLEWREIFGDDYYIELQRHNIENLDGTGISQEDINQILLKWSEKYKVPAIATNDSHYVEEEDADAHDILLCVNTGELKSTPVGKGADYNKKGTRFGFPNEQFYFKTQAEMEQTFKDIPHVLDNTQMIVDSINTPKLERDILLPNFAMPSQFATQDEYLRYLTFEGAKKRYGEISQHVEERINFELSVIKDSGYPGYFLIVQDFTSAAREMGVSVGPGRGSAAGSVVAYCIGITNVDPIKYDLLFERFLNPERVSMPDIDIDFDDEGRQQVIDFVVDKYGKNQVAQIITYGSMAAKMSLRDVGRVLDVPLQEVNQVAKVFPDHLSATLKKVLNDKGVDPKLESKLNSEQKHSALEFRKLAEKDDAIGKMIREAKKLEGSIRSTGVHACGVIITPDDITQYLPMTVAKDSDLLLTQFDNSVVEKAGLLKMDFLGLKTLTIIKDAIKLIEKRHGITIVADEIPLTDEKTFELFQKGLTNGVFQFESPGMQKNLKSLKPDKFEDIIAMNALYRPGPMEYIPNYIARKHGKEEIVYDIPIMEEKLKETYGITVYQEQVMLLSQVLAGFTKGQADSLRKAMGKKIKAMMDDLYPKFVDGCVANGHDKKAVEKVWKDWEAFAEYAFNKSHSTCYAVLAFQTAYLKANYPAEFMASVLGHNKNDIKKVTFYMEECKRIKVPVLGPDVNESSKKFTVNANGEIRFALSAIKGVGEAAVDAIVEEREKNGEYKDIFDFTSRVNLRAVNKKSVESMAVAGAFDRFEGLTRAQFTVADPIDNLTLTEKAIKFGNAVQNSTHSAATSLFGELAPIEVTSPKIHTVEDFSLIEKLNKEKELIGVYLTGHPLDNYALEVKSYSTATTQTYKNKPNQSVKIAGIVSSCSTRFTKKGTRFCNFTIEDYEGSLEIFLFGSDYVEFSNYVEIIGNMILITGSYQSKPYNKDEYHFKISRIDLLEELHEQLTEGIVISVELNQINDEFIDNILAVIENHPGQHNVGIQVVDREEQIGVDLYSKSKRVNVSQDFINDLTEVCDVQYKLN